MAEQEWWDGKGVVTNRGTQIVDTYQVMLKQAEEIASLKAQLAEYKKVITTIKSLRSDALEIFSGSHTLAELDVIEWYSESIDAAMAQKEQS
jgi:hypothetical protein